MRSKHRRRDPHAHAASSPRLPSSRLPALHTHSRPRSGTQQHSSFKVRPGGSIPIDGVLARALYSVGALEGAPPPPPPEAVLNFGALGMSLSTSPRDEGEQAPPQPSPAQSSPYTTRLVTMVHRDHLPRRSKRRRRGKSKRRGRADGGSRGMREQFRDQEPRQHPRRQRRRSGDSANASSRGDGGSPVQGLGAGQALPDIHSSLYGVDVDSGGGEDDAERGKSPETEQKAPEEQTPATPQPRPAPQSHTPASARVARAVTKQQGEAEVGRLQDTVGLVMGMVEVGGLPPMTGHPPAILHVMVDAWRRPDAHLAADLAEFGLTADLATVTSAVKGLLRCISYMIAPGLAVMAPYVSQLDEDEQAWDDEAVAELGERVREAVKDHTIEALSLVEELGIVKVSPAVLPGAAADSMRVASRYPLPHELVEGALRSLHVLKLANESRRILPPELFHHAELNEALRLCMSAAWRGDAVAQPPRGGYPVNLPAAILGPLFLTDAALSSGEDTSGGQGGSRCFSPLTKVSLVLDGATKAMLLQPTLASHAAAANGSGVVPVLKATVHRDSAFEDAFHAAVAASVLRGVPDGASPAQPRSATTTAAVPDALSHGTLRVVYPLFKTAAASGGGSSVEEGEGHGPRKEFFSMIASQLASTWLPEWMGTGPVSGSEASTQLTGPGVTALRHGYRVTIPPRPDARHPGLAGAAARDGATTAAVPPRVSGNQHSSPTHASSSSPSTRAARAAPTAAGSGAVFTANVAAALSATEVALDQRLPRTFRDEPFSYSRPCIPIMEYRQGAEAFWPRAAIDNTPEAQGRYIFLGWLLAAAVMNRAQLDFRVPPTLLSLIMAARVGSQGSVPAAPELLSPDGRRGAAVPPRSTSGGDGDGGGRRGAGTAGGSTDSKAAVSHWDYFSPDVHDLRDLDPELVATASKVRRMAEGEFAAVLEAEGMPASTTKDEYLSVMIHELIVDSVEWQVNALRQGFRDGLGTEGIAAMKALGVTAHDLVDMVCSPKQLTDFDVAKTFRVVSRADAREWPELLDALWSTVNGWPLPKKRKFLAFVTGVDKLPAPQSEVSDCAPAARNVCCCERGSRAVHRNSSSSFRSWLLGRQNTSASWAHCLKHMCVAVAACVVALPCPWLTFLCTNPNTDLHQHYRAAELPRVLEGA